MTTDHLIFFSIPGLRPGDIDAKSTPTLFSWAQRGFAAELTPTFPCVTSCVQAAQWTGSGPRSHGVVANGFYDRDRHEVEFWVGTNRVISGEQIWDAIRGRRPEMTLAVWHAQNIKGASADFIVTPAPIHEPDGTMKLWCYSKPGGLYQNLLDRFGHFPLQHYWGPLSNIESTHWILRAAAWIHETHAPNFHWIYIPHLDYAAQKFGPDSPQARSSLLELDVVLGEFAGRVAATPSGPGIVFVAAGEYAMTEVTGVVYPNRLLRKAGWLCVCEEDGKEQIDLGRSAAFAMVDHQFAHVYLRAGESGLQDRVCEVLKSVPGIAGAYAGSDRAELGMDHPRSGEIILVAEDAHWFAYFWWLEDAAAPGYARTVDIHRKPGYDPVELFLDPVARGIPLDATLVKGSHGVPATRPHLRTAFVCSSASRELNKSVALRDTDLKRFCLDLLS